MERRIGVIAIIVSEKNSIRQLNSILSDNSGIILGRMGLPLRGKGVNVISLIIEGTTDQIGTLSGKAGRLPGVQVKSVLAKNVRCDNE